MALNDLMNDLQNNSITLDDSSEKSISRSVLKLLDDKNGEVQNLTVKCLPPLISRLKDPQVEVIVDSLLANMENEQSGKEQLRDISSMGLKSVIPELDKSHPAIGGGIARKVITRLTAVCGATHNTAITLESMDIIADSLLLFGSTISSVHRPLLWECLYPNLKHDRMAVRKKAINAISNLVVNSSGDMFYELFEVLLKSCSKENRTNLSVVCTTVQCISAVTRKAGHRLSEPIIRNVIPVMLELIEIDNSDETCDIKESCLQTFEALIRRCPKEVEAYSDVIIHTSLKYLCYDPNYSYDNDDDDSMSTEKIDYDNEDDDDDEYNDVSDDDDVSWKVRRASAKVLEALVASKPHTAVQFYNKNRAAILVSRFKEREESVKDDIFQTFIVLLRQTKMFINSSISGGDSMDISSGPSTVLQSLVPIIVKESKKMFKSPSMKTRQGIFMVLNDLVITLPGCLSEHFSTIVPGVERCFEDRYSTANLKLDCLVFVSSSLKNHSKEVFYPHLPKLVSPILKGANDKFYRISADSLAVLQMIVEILLPVDDTDVHAANQDMFTHVFDVVYSKLRAVELDQDVKENAIACMAQIIYNGGDCLGSNLQACLKILVEKLNNEVTRLYAVKAFTKIASSPRKLEFKYEANQAVPLLINFLKKNHRVLRLSSVECLYSLIRRHDAEISTDHYTFLIETLPIVLTENDLQITQTALNLLQLVVSNNPGIAPKVFKDVFQSVLGLLRSPVLQGAPLDAMLNFLQSLCNPGKIAFDALYKPLHDFIFSQAEVQHKQTYSSVAQAVALLSIVTEKHVQIVIEYSNFLAQRSTDAVRDVSRIFCLNTIGEIGKRVDLSQHESLPALILNAFESQNEEMKNAASIALGGVTVCAVQSFLPFVLNQLKNQQKSRNLYLLLKSLKEFIVVLLRRDEAALRALDRELWNNLMSYSDCAEEGTRSVVAECLGRLTLVNYSVHLAYLKQCASNPNPLVASTVVTAVKFAITDKPHPIDEHLRSAMGDFLSCLKHEDVNLRRLTLVMLNSAAHNKPALIRGQLNNVLALLYKQTLEDKSLIKLVEMGPFKHEYDMGLDLRKTAFECMYTLLGTCLDKIPDIFEYLTYLQNGLKDRYDIKMLAHLMLIKLSVLVPGAVWQRLDKIMEAIKLTITSKVKNDSVKQEYDKQEEIKKSALRAIYALTKVPEAERSPAVMDVITLCKASYPDLYAYYENLKKENSNVTGMSRRLGMAGLDMMDTS